MNIDDVSRRAQEIQVELDGKKAQLDAGEISHKAYNEHLDCAFDEIARLRTVKKALREGNQAVARQEAAFSGSTLETKAFGVSPKPPTPMDITPAQLKALEMAMDARTPFQIEVGTKGGELAPWMAGISTKSAVLESGISGGFSGNLPPVQTPYAVGLGYEPTRIASLLPGAAMPGPSAAWLSHTANSAEVAAVAEGGTKGDIGPTITENQVKPQKIAGLVSTSLEAWQDTSAYGQAALSSWLPQELTRSLINAESEFLLLATTAGSNSYSGGPTNATFNGLLNVSGTLTRAVGSDTPLDAMNKAYIDVRTGAAFAEPDLVIMHPTTWGALRREKSSFGTYILDQATGPLGLTADGSPASAGPAGEPNAFSIIKQGTPASYGSLWGVRVACTTQCPAGTSIVMSVRAGGGIFWTRLGLLLQFNPWGDTEWTTNTFSWRAEERVALSVPRPTAVNIVTGLPTS